MINNPKNISSLDLFRRIAGYGVGICHFYYYLYDLNNFQFYSIFFVEFFFVLSGFVLYPQLLKVINILGETVKNLHDGFLDADIHSFIWDGKDYSGVEMPSGLYIYKLESNNIFLSFFVMLKKQMRNVRRETRQI